MGIFPIIMNIIQFWTIDSIVKASTATMSTQDIESTNHDHQPLFMAPAEDDDDQSPPRLETANRSSSRHSFSSLNSQDREPHVIQTPIIIPDEHKSGASSSKRLVDVYAYPPSLSSSISSDHFSILNSIKENNFGKKYRDRSPGQRSADPFSKSSSLVPRTPSPQFTAFGIAQDQDIWEDTNERGKYNERSSTVSKQNVLLANGSWRNAQQHLRSD